MKRLKIKNFKRFTRIHLKWLLLLIIVGFFIQTSASAWTLRPEEIVVVANRNYPHSVSLAKYYMKQRNIPKDQLIKLRATDKEGCSREEYDKKIAAPVRKYLEKRDPNGLLFRCIVLMYGIPLRVSSPEPGLEDKKEIERLKKKGWRETPVLTPAFPNQNKRKNPPLLAPSTPPFMQLRI